MRPLASILIVNYNAGTHLRTCLNALKAQTAPDFEVLILDNASEDGSIADAKQAVEDDPRFTLILEDRNHGFAGGNNRAASRARAHWIITLNPDAFPEPDWLEQILAATKQHPDVAMFGSTQLDAAQPGLIDGAGDRYFAAGIPWRDQTSDRLRQCTNGTHNVYDTFSPCAAAAAYRSDAFNAVEGFDERFFCFVEDVDLGFRLRLRGETCLQVSDAKVLHVGGGAGGGQSDFARYHGTRNLIWCFFKNMPILLLLLLLPVHMATLAALAIKALFRGNAGPVLRGMKDGLVGLGAIWWSRRVSQRAKGAKGNIVGAVDWSPLPYLARRRQR
ncbi:MAG: glycosyl transferase [Alphaproteobacteria bacterium]|nr:glycosyl transferase [Alphaproteobacteria bacterium]